MAYVPRTPYSEVDPKVAEWLSNELRSISVEFKNPDMDIPTFQVQTEEPAKPADGDVAYADGTGWDPGRGEGLYFYFNNMWHDLVDATESETVIMTDGGSSTLADDGSKIIHMEFDATEYLAGGGGGSQFDYDITLPPNPRDGDEYLFSLGLPESLTGAGSPAIPVAGIWPLGQEIFVHSNTGHIFSNTIDGVDMTMTRLFGTGFNEFITAIRFGFRADTGLWWIH